MYYSHLSLVISHLDGNSNEIVPNDQWPMTND
jgi:hypothetical protein